MPQTIEISSHHTVDGKSFHRMAFKRLFKGKFACVRILYILVTSKWIKWIPPSSVLVMQRHSLYNKHHWLSDYRSDWGLLHFLKQDCSILVLQRDSVKSSCKSLADFFALFFLNEYRFIFKQCVCVHIYIHIHTLPGMSTVVKMKPCSYQLPSV